MITTRKQLKEKIEDILDGCHAFFEREYNIVNRITFEFKRNERLFKGQEVTNYLNIDITFCAGTLEQDFQKEKIKQNLKDIRNHVKACVFKDEDIRINLDEDKYNLNVKFKVI